MGTLISWNPLGHSRPVTGLLFFLTDNSGLLNHRYKKKKGHGAFELHCSNAVAWFIVMYCMNGTVHQHKSCRVRAFGLYISVVRCLPAIVLAK